MPVALPPVLKIKKYLQTLPKVYGEAKLPLMENH
jgi:hypothetical protein